MSVKNLVAVIGGARNPWRQANSSLTLRISPARTPPLHHPARNNTTQPGRGRPIWHRGYTADEAAAGARFCASAAYHGIRTHNAIKALHLDHLFGSEARRCKPNAQIEKLTSRFKAAEVWNAHRKLGQATAYAAMDTAMKLADRHGVGMVSVDNAFHYLWGGGYVMDAAKKGYIAYTNCTAALAEVVPFGGKYPTLGTNPHSWGFPTTPPSATPSSSTGPPAWSPWAASSNSREGKQLPPRAVDENGVADHRSQPGRGLLPFGAHKGYGLSLINELYAGFIGGSLPAFAELPRRPRRKTRLPLSSSKSSTPRPCAEIISPRAAPRWKTSKPSFATSSATATSIACSPARPKPRAGELSHKHGGLLFTEAEIKEFSHLAREINEPAWTPPISKSVQV